MSDHYIYFLKCNEFIKIGHTSNVRQRIMSIGRGMPYNVQLLALIVYDTKSKAIADEARLHKTYKNINHSGEWFINLDIEAEWSKIYALTYRAKDYIYNIDLDNNSDITGDVFSNDDPDALSVKKIIPKQKIPKTDMVAPKNSKEVIYHLFFRYPSLKSGNRKRVNEYLDFDVSEKTISDARANFKSYFYYRTNHRSGFNMILSSVENNYTVSEIRNKWNLPLYEATKIKELTTVHKVCLHYVIKEKLVL